MRVTGGAGWTLAGMIRIESLTVAEFQARPELPALLAEYRAESAVEEFKATAAPQWGTYAQLEAMGMLRVLCAFDGPQLVGFASVLASVLPHFGVLMASTESYFVASAARHTGAGLALLRQVQAVAREVGAVGLMVSAPEGSRLARVLAATDMRTSHRIFFKPLGGQSRGLLTLPVLDAPPALPALDDGDRALVGRFEAVLLQQPQVRLETRHTLHAGMYARTLIVPAGIVCTGAHITRATLLIVDGDASLFVGGEERARRYTGRHVLTGQPGRKQVLLAHAETHVTMVFPTDAACIEDAEDEFTDEAPRLGSRRQGARNTIAITEH